MRPAPTDSHGRGKNNVPMRVDLNHGRATGAGLDTLTNVEFVMLEMARTCCSAAVVPMESPPRDIHGCWMRHVVLVGSNLTVVKELRLGLKLKERWLLPA